ncbi:hypothetical protein [Deinococcus hopiensis]|uniref:Uncharacterized protein n=1 Tax=Deinococcus hopiensis KR-140 TaxID=695939 RepID=A0A1W1V5E4_9DEIO|nr:hypothetical protein [Deinococcus hopiensis]SMB88568.1 hypothetical protein SAMN00790413_00105 [Deinococcus hopiensis KR-140]
MLESSEEEFTARFRAFAADGELYPQPEGSPLLEFAAGGRVLYLFDRSGPYAAVPGPARVLVHGILGPGQIAPLPAEAAGERREALTVVGVSAVEGRGEVLASSAQICVVRARLPLVLASFSPLPPLQVGGWVTFQTLPPLHGFVL